jgi:hypothetical protein
LASARHISEKPLSARVGHVWPDIGWAAVWEARRRDYEYVAYVPDGAEVSLPAGLDASTIRLLGA